MYWLVNEFVIVIVFVETVVEHNADEESMFRVETVHDEPTVRLEGRVITSLAFAAK